MYVDSLQGPTGRLAASGLEGFDAELTKRYSDVHGCILQVEVFEQYVLKYIGGLMEASSQFPSCSLKIYSRVSQFTLQTSTNNASHDMKASI